MSKAREIDQMATVDIHGEPADEQPEPIADAAGSSADEEEEGSSTDSD